MNDGGCPSQTVESSPVNVGYLKTDGHLEAIGVQLEEPIHTHMAIDIHFKCTHNC